MDKKSQILEDMNRDFNEALKSATSEGEKKMYEKQKENLLNNPKMKIVLKYEFNRPKNEAEFRELCSVVCFGSLTWCCGVEGNKFGGWKPCYFRDIVLGILGIDSKKFFEIKKRVDDDILKEVKGC